MILKPNNHTMVDINNISGVSL